MKYNPYVVIYTLRDSPQGLPGDAGPVGERGPKGETVNRPEVNEINI